MFTNPLCLNDGFGENFKLIILSIIYCEKNNLDFVYSPFLDMEHNYDNDINYLENKEKLINIKYNYKLNDEKLEAQTISNFDLLYFYENNLNYIESSSSLKNIKKVFKMNKFNPFNVNYTNIAIHIRRMNDHDLRRTGGKNYNLPGTDVPFEFYKTIMEQLNNAYNNVKFHIYSQGDINDFYELNDNSKYNIEFNIKFNINKNLEDTFIEIVYADILVLSPSCLSISAGLLSEGIIYYIPFCNPPLPSWNIIQGYKSSRDKYEYLIKVPPTFQYELFYFNPKINRLEKP